MGNRVKVDIDDLLGNEDHEIIKSFLSAVLMVPNHYVSYNVELNDDDGLINEHQERVFAYELYHKWSCLLEEQKMFDKGWVLNAELSKHLDWFYNDDEELKRERGQNVEKSDLRFPDLVLHKGQNNQEDNFLVCEIKRGERINETNLFKDLYKLCRLTVEECRGEREKVNHGRYSLPFKYGIFLCLNNKMKDMAFTKKVCKNLERYKCCMKKILCIEVVYNRNGFELACDTLFNIYNNLENTK